MKKLILPFLVLFCSFSLHAQVGIGIETPHASSILDVTSTSKGLLMPRMTTVQRDDIASPATGLFVFNTTTNNLNMFNGVIWYEFTTTATQGLVATIDTAGATTSGTLTAGSAASSVSTSFNYTGGNGKPYPTQSYSSTGVTGLTATLTAGTMANGNGSLSYTITGTPSGSGTATFTITVGGQTSTFSVTVYAVGSIASLTNCGSPTNNGTLTSGVAASSVSSVISYSGGNGGTHSGQTVTSTGVTGLTATLSSGIFTSSTGNLTYNITGTPSASGTATFAISIGGQTCNLTRTVVAPSNYAAGTVHCMSGNTPTAIVEITNTTTGKTWMDRNIGASRAATYYNDPSAEGDFFQWGRGADGHQCRTSSVTSTPSSTDQPGNSSFISSSGNWRSTANVNLWQGVDGINNPCPTGYRVPSSIELNNERLTWSQNNETGAYNSPMKFVTTQQRNETGSFAGVGSSSYWSSTLSTAPNVNVLAIFGNPMMVTKVIATGVFVRCIKN